MYIPVICRTQTIGNYEHKSIPWLRKIAAEYYLNYIANQMLENHWFRQVLSPDRNSIRYGLTISERSCTYRPLYGMRPDIAGMNVSIQTPISRCIQFFRPIRNCLYGRAKFSLWKNLILFRWTDFFAILELKNRFWCNALDLLSLPHVVQSKRNGLPENMSHKIPFVVNWTLHRKAKLLVHIPIPWSGLMRHRRGLNSMAVGATIYFVPNRVAAKLIEKRWEASVRLYGACLLPVWTGHHPVVLFAVTTSSRKTVVFHRVVGKCLTYWRGANCPAVWELPSRPILPSTERH